MNHNESEQISTNLESYGNECQRKDAQDNVSNPVHDQQVIPVIRRERKRERGGGGR